MHWEHQMYKLGCGCPAQEWPRGDTPCPRSGAAAMRRYPMSNVRETQGRRQALREGIRGQADWNHNHRQLANLITWATALSNAVKLSHAVWGYPRPMGRGGEVWQNVVHWRREWQTISVFLPWEPHGQYEKAKI